MQDSDSTQPSHFPHRSTFYPNFPRPEHPCIAFPKTRFLQLLVPTSPRLASLITIYHESANCILRVVERANAPLIYLSRDAAESEIRLLQSLLVKAMLDKIICAMSSVFIGASGSTFTQDIIKKDWGSSSLCHEYLFHSEESNIVAEME
ncbi:O-fucosyltransferase 5 [Vigna angularis]|uniref:O-fucosyltransferase 5 n=1 Tax=Phaseolus angularis TaxID=3914 RepID=A0A8T0KML6_PHAAN|nr:O-fucosyltransferase 5 [Vigna angularis]